MFLEPTTEIELFLEELKNYQKLKIALVTRKASETDKYEN